MGVALGGFIVRDDSMHLTWDVTSFTGFMLAAYAHAPDSPILHILPCTNG